MLTKQEIVTVLIELYEKVLEIEDIDIYACYAFGVQQGICAAMARHLGHNSSEIRDNYNTMSDLIDKYADWGKHWGPTPEHVNSMRTLGDIQSVLEYRLNILYEIRDSFGTAQ